MRAQCLETSLRIEGGLRLGRPRLQYRSKINKNKKRYLTRRLGRENALHDPSAKTVANARSVYGHLVVDLQLTVGQDHPNINRNTDTDTR